MVRLMLVLAPVMCILSGIGISTILTTYMKNLETASSNSSSGTSSSAVGKDKKTKKFDDYPKKSEVRNCCCCFRAKSIYSFDEFKSNKQSNRLFYRLPASSSSSCAYSWPCIRSTAFG